MFDSVQQLLLKEFQLGAVFMIVPSGSGPSVSYGRVFLYMSSVSSYLIGKIDSYGAGGGPSAVAASAHSH